jgi:hypothetical protein
VISKPRVWVASELLQLTQCRPGLPEHLKVYVMQAHPTNPSHVVIGANIGIFVLDIASAYSVLASTVALSPSQSLIHLDDTGALKVSGQSHLNDEDTTAQPLPLETVATSVVPPGSGMAKLSISQQALHGGAMISASSSGAFVSLVWPHLKCYSIFAVTPSGDGRRVAKVVNNGAGVDVVWGPHDTFAVLDPVIVMKTMPKTVKGAPDTKPEPPRPPTLSVKAIVPSQEGTGGVAVNALVKSMSLAKSAVFLFGGPLLALGLAADSVAANWDVSIGACEHGNAALSTYTQLYEWTPKITATTATSGRVVETQTLKPVGPAFPTPLWIVWDPVSSSRVALCYSDHVDVLGLSGTASDAASKRKAASKVFTRLCSVRFVSPPRHALWYKRSVFVLTATQCLLICPQLVTVDTKASLSFAATLGTSGALVIPITSLYPSPPAYTGAATVMDTSHSVLLGVVNGALVVASKMSTGHWTQTRVPLTNPFVRMAICASIEGQTLATVSWASTLPPSLHTVAAVLLAVRFCGVVSGIVVHSMWCGVAGTRPRQCWCNAPQG